MCNQLCLCWLKLIRDEILILEYCIVLWLIIILLFSFQILLFISLFVLRLSLSLQWTIQQSRSSHILAFYSGKNQSEQSIKFVWRKYIWLFCKYSIGIINFIRFWVRWIFRILGAFINQWICLRQQKGHYCFILSIFFKPLCNAVATLFLPFDPNLPHTFIFTLRFAFTFWRFLPLFCFLNTICDNFPENIVTFT